jgi:hypothetical protein
MHLDRNSVLPFTQLERPLATLHLEVAMMATGAPSEFALAPHDETSSTAHLGRLRVSDI